MKLSRPLSRRLAGMGRSLGLLALVLAGVFTLPGVARAQVITSERGRHASPQHFALEFRFSPYKPDIDSEFEGTNRHPYQDFFGSGRHLLSQLEFDYQIIRHVGSLGVGASVGYFKTSGKNLIAETDMASADESSLRLIPFSISAVYRFDLPYERLNIPLVPYGKLGFDYVLWTVNNGNEEVPSAGGRTRSRRHAGLARRRGPVAWRSTSSIPMPRPTSTRTWA